MRISSKILAVAALTVLAAPVAAQDANNGWFSFHRAVPQLVGNIKENDGGLLDLSKLAIWKSDMRKALAAWKKGDFEKARRYWEKAYESGNVKAAWHLGNLYRLGNLGQPEMARALGFYNEVATYYDPDRKNKGLNALALDSILWIADAYRLGVEEAGIGRQPQRAYNLYMLARSHNSSGRAEFGIGVMYLNGMGVAKRPRRGLRLLSLSARRAFPPALALLGDLSWSGKYLRHDRIEGLKWYILAMRHLRRDQHDYIRDRFAQLETDATSEELIYAEQAADEWEHGFIAKIEKREQALLPEPPGSEEAIAPAE